MSVADDYFARVRPLLGTGLSKHVVEIDDAELGLLVIELLASCMLQHVVVTKSSTVSVLERAIAWKQPFAPLTISTTRSSAMRSSVSADARISMRRGTPAIVWGVGVDDIREVTVTVDPDDVLSLVDISYHVARGVRDALLGGAWPSRTIAQPFDPRGIAIDLRGRHIVVVGCGSLGSEALRMLAGSGARLTLVDDAQVTVYNLARQWFGADDVGRAKVDALRDRLDARTRGRPVDTRTWRRRLDTADLPAFESLLRDDPADVVLLATGTHHHAMIAACLWRMGISHLAACCYPRARYFEVSIHCEDTPCLHCYRGHLYRGAPDTPVPDDVAAFLYAPMSDDARAQKYNDLVAEPASRIETLRAAHVLARCAVELLSSTRSPWFTRVLADQTTCVLGGNAAGAYGITSPGQVIRLGLDDIIGTTDHVRCDVCQREMRVHVREDQPVALDDDAELALTMRGA